MMDFRCLYCGEEEFLAVDHWKVCLNCGDKDYILWAMSVVSGLKRQKAYEESFKKAQDPKGRPTPRPLGESE
jgi:hypothetical protein